MPNKPSKVMLSGTIDPDVFESLARYCAAHPQQSRSQVLTRALRQLLLPDFQEERERVLAENLDRLYWHQHNHAERVDRDLRVLTEMVALGIRTFYNHTPAMPEGMRAAAAADGEARFARFLEVVAEHVGPGRSALERMPEPAVATGAVAGPDEDALLTDEPEEERHDDDDQ
jgi:hypothetical protein